MLAELIKPVATAFGPERLNTVGASEIGRCARQTWFRKREQPEDTPHPGWGFRERGHNVEAWVMERLGDAVAHAQHFVHRGFMSATVDCSYNGEPVDIKSVDPRISRLPKHEHVMQVRQQAFLMDAPRGHLLYVNCSDYQDMKEFTFEAADYSARAQAIMTGPMPSPEGRITDDGECALCPYQIACLGEPVTGKGKLADAEAAVVSAARDEYRLHSEAAAAAESLAKAAKERIRDVLRAADVYRAPGLARISRSARTTLDAEAMERDGIDLTPYRKTGRMSESVTLE